MRISIIVPGDRLAPGDIDRELTMMPSAGFPETQGGSRILDRS